MIKQTKIISRMSLALGLVLLLGAGLASAQSGSLYELVSWTVDNGGETVTQGGQYELLSTVGQPDAYEDISGGEYVVQSGFWPAYLESWDLYLPLLLKAVGPDLVGSFTLTPDKSSYSAGEPVLVTATVTNIGGAPAGAFWVDFYINPTSLPAVNRRWNDLCSMSPCYGLAWYVADGLAPGQSVTLLSSPASYAQPQSVWEGTLPPGTTDLYLYVDVWNPGVSTGGVQEIEEANNRSYRGGLSVSGQGVGSQNLPRPEDVAPAPLRKRLLRRCSQ